MKRETTPFNMPSKKEKEIGESISLGSMSRHKMEAVEEVFARMGINSKIESFSESSEVNTQPFGMEETYKGAFNRARKAQANKPASIGIGIENGVIPLSDKFIDLAVIVVILPDGTEFAGTSAGIEFPAELVEAARTQGFENVTVGDFIAEKMGGDKADPHATLTKGRITRKEILVEAITSVLARALNR
jgi:inosine/xanthosine triphosphatase